MNIEEQRKAFDRWVLTHHDNLDLTAYEENIMFDAWLASTNREGYKFVPLEATQEMVDAVYNSTLDSDDLEGIYKAMIGAHNN